FSGRSSVRTILLFIFSRVSLREDSEGHLQFVNLNRHQVATQEQGLDIVFLTRATSLMFLGDTNRTIAETPMNPASTRSHCVFTVYVNAKKEGSDVIRRSKLHIVDLAG